MLMNHKRCAELLAVKRGKPAFSVLTLIRCLRQPLSVLYGFRQL